MQHFFLNQMILFRSTLLILCLAFSMLSATCNPRVSRGKTESVGPALSFPGAEGFGKYTTGGRGGKVVIVSNLDDKGPGSLREAVKDKLPKIIVFTVSGTIHLESPLSIKDNTTIAGQSAPGDGICVADHPVSLGGNNIIIRFMRFRMGDRYQNKGMVAGAGHDDAFSAQRRKHIIIDHCSLSWSTDEVMSVYAGDSTTLQWNIISEPLNYSYHFEKGDTDFQRHGYGGIWGGAHATFHHNLIAHCNSRTPRFDGIRNAVIENCDYRNNVIYNWGSNNVYAGEGGNYNIVNNYYKFGPSTKESVKYRIANPFSKKPDIPFGKWFIKGNYVDGSTEVTHDNWKGVVFDKGTDADAKTSRLERSLEVVEINTQAALDAYEAVLKQGGCVLPSRDTLDQRIISDVRNRKGGFIDVQGGYPHGTPYAQTVNAWPALKSLPAPTDSDSDGMPDDWEKKNKLNANNPSDAASYYLAKSYTNIEVYLNSLVNIK
jgi:pectate lyase